MYYTVYIYINSYIQKCSLMRSYYNLAGNKTCNNVIIDITPENTACMEFKYIYKL